MSRRVSRRNFLRQTGAAVMCASALPHCLISQTHQIAEASRNDSSVQAIISSLTELIPDLMNKKGVPGLSVALISDARVVWVKGFGLRNTATREPVSADTVFEAASLSKPAFAYVALKLVDEGKLSLDKPLAEYISVPFVSTDARLKLVTARMVLSHSSGLPHGRPGGSVPVTLRFTPGTKFAYSATGIQYLQMVVESLTKKPIAELLKENLLDPFGMSNSSFGWVSNYETTAALGYGKDSEPGLSGNGRYLQKSAEEKESISREFPEYRYPSASAGLYTTAGDYARFMIEIIQPSARDRFHLSETLFTDMLKPQVKINGALDWGLGWGLEHTDAGDAFWHWGDWGVFRNFAMAYRNQRTGVVVLTNSFNGPKVYKEIVPQALGGKHPAISWVEDFR